jgi:AcrR family transcriptional regulator
VARPPHKSPAASPSRRALAQASSSHRRTSAEPGARRRTSRASEAPPTRASGESYPRSASATKGDKAKPRRRRDAASARAAILDAADRHLVTVGPSGIRLQEVAADAGVSHPTVLHHFGSREGLVKAVVTRSLAEINLRLVEALAQSTGEPAQVAAMLDGVFDALAAHGRARVVMWLALEGQRIEGDARLASVVDATHALRKARRADHPRRGLAREDTAHLIVLATLALIGAAVMGPAVLENAGLTQDAAAERRFRGWLAALLSKHFDEV